MTTGATERLCLIATIAGQHVAVPADEVGSVVDLGPLAPVPGADRSVRGLAALRSQVVTVIDPRAQLGGGEAAAPGRAMVTRAEGHEYAVMVDDCSDIAALPVEPLPAGMLPSPQWRSAARGLARREDKPLLLIALDALLPPAPPVAA